MNPREEGTQPVAEAIRFKIGKSLCRNARSFATQCNGGSKYNATARHEKGTGLLDSERTGFSSRFVASDSLDGR